ncbi:MAG: hypothetical protein GY827_05815 [Cytophagales bacterium]|nr:hypothetical protein [Cytophagales bacterium]
MKKITFYLLFTVFAFSSTWAQVNEDIKRKSQQNNQNNNSGGTTSNPTPSSPSNTNSYSNNDNQSIGSSCADACASGCINMGVSILTDIILGVNREYVNAVKDDKSYISHLDIDLNVGFLPNRYVVLLPHISGQYGVFSTDFRIYSNFERRLEKLDIYTTYDWQILGINFLSLDNVNARLSSGFLSEGFEGGTSYNEHMLSFQVYPSSALKFNTELRLTHDYENIWVRQEVNIRASYRLPITDSERTQFNLILGGLYARYYESVEVWTVSAGVGITFE